MQSAISSKVCRYIPLNPVEAGPSRTTPTDWQWGGYRANIGLRHTRGRFIAPTCFSGYSHAEPACGTPALARDGVREWQSRLAGHGPSSNDGGQTRRRD